MTDSNIVVFQLTINLPDESKLHIMVCPNIRYTP